MACQIARIVFPLSAFLTLWSRASASDWVRVSVDIWNLSYADITPSGKEGLSWGYASDLATALSVPVADVRDLDGASAHVTLLAEADPSPSSTTSVEQSTTQPATSTSSGAAGNSSAANATTTPLATSSTTREASTTRLPTPAPTSSPNGTGMPPLWPMQGVAYGALPCKGQTCSERGLPSQDMLQIGYEAQWGASGRDDLGVMRALGGNAVRMYHSFGLNTRSDHGGFLNRAQELGVNVMPGFHTEMSHECQEFDCFEAWKNAASKGFQLGYQQGSGWHPAVAMVILLNEPDFMEFSPQCQQNNPGAWCRVRAALSALDGLLAAEREAGVAAGRVNLTIAWSFGMMHSIDDQVYGPGYFGFQDMKVAVANPQLAGYTPRTPQAEFEEAYRTRWVNCLNTQAPWDFVNSVISGNYEPFKPTPWFIGEYGANGQPRDVIEQDLRDMQRHAASDAAFMGVNFFQFQTANQKGGSEMNFGMFDLGDEAIGETGGVCDDGLPCLQWPVRCLTSDLAFLPGTLSQRAQAVAAAWNGSLQHDSLCGGRRLAAAEEAEQAPLTRVECYVRAPAASVASAVSSSALRQRLARRTAFELGTDSPAIAGSIAVGGAASEAAAAPPAPTVASGSSAPVPEPRRLPWRFWLVVAAAAAFLSATSAAAACCVVRSKIQRAASSEFCEGNDV
mmetsp:Transcript_106721/g.344362  ORF Transcript_106721/g.344362 Transcript_106721/m.344362 type:complete len:678 (+) Transcript_106721:77-2110(+)